MSPWVRGRLLVSAPDLTDPNFRRSVVLMLAHDPDGALGLVLNRPTDISVNDTMPAWQAVSSPPAVLFMGGPVDPESVVALGVAHGGASIDAIVGGFEPVDLDADPNAVHSVRMFVGYSGWGAGQLDAELAAGGWLVLDAVSDDLTSSAPDGLWRAVLRRQRGSMAWLATAPEDPSLN
ncbi:MAG: YqgE/AlgH family protein [Acidimicrobiia bacterium]|nr:YqgE/AlgH family protein [Acidimicrobiia bacterium]